MRSAKEILDAKVSDQEASQNVKKIALEEAEMMIKNYCNRDSVPWRLFYTWANMAADIIKGRYTTQDAGKIPDHEIGSISAGDMSISRSSDLVAHKVDVDNLAKQYSNELNNFRLFRWRA